MNKATGECVEVEVQEQTFAFGVQFENGAGGAITLGSGLGCVCRKQAQGGPDPPPKAGFEDACGQRLGNREPRQGRHQVPRE